LKSLTKKVNNRYKVKSGNFPDFLFIDKPNRTKFTFNENHEFIGFIIDFKPKTIIDFIY